MRNDKEAAVAMREFTAAWVRANIKNPDMKNQATRLADSIEQGVLTFMSEALTDEVHDVRRKMALLCASNIPQEDVEWRTFVSEITASLRDLFETGTHFNLTTILQLWAHVAEGLKLAAS